jgi:uncharacterized protein
MKKIKQTSLDAGRFSTWLRNIRKVLAFESCGMNVPCGECHACCNSSYFVHIKPEETRTLCRIPNELLFPAPLLPIGYLVLGYNEHGCCPMFVGNKCSIYRFRPATCRSFDCRILAASGITTEDNNLITQHARRWKFSCPIESDRNLLSAVLAAAIFLKKYPECIRGNLASRDKIQLAVIAIKVYDVFLNNNVTTVNFAQTTHDSEIAKKVLKSYKMFEKRKRVA